MGGRAVGAQQETPGHCLLCGRERLAQVGRKGDFDVLKCSACGSVTSFPIPSQHDVDSAYRNQKIPAYYSARANSKLRRARKRVAGIRRHIESGRFLDVGCSLGYTVKAAADAGFDAFGIDPSAAAVSAGQRMFPGLDLRQGTVEKELIEPASLSVLFAAEVIEHLANPASLLDRAAQWLRPGGLIYLTTPDAGHWRVPRDVASWRMVLPPHHLTLMTKRGLREALSRRGFGDIHFDLTFKRQIRVLARCVDGDRESRNGT